MLNDIKNIEFWKATGIRAVYTVAETALGMIGTATIISEVNWKYTVSACALSAVVSVLKSIILGVPEV
jgi:hypothetical protein